MTLPTVVFLHAFPLSSDMWEPQLQAVGGAGFPVLALNVPGFGRAPSHGERTMQEFAHCIIEALGAARVADAVLVGLSMGGYVSFRILERQPRDLHVRGVVLADTKAAPDAPDARTRRLQMAARVESEGTAFLLTELVPKLLAPDVNAETLELVRKIVRRAAPSAVYNALAALASRPDSRMMLEDIDVPTLVLVGEHDAVTPLGDAQEMASTISGARLEVIPGAGHLSNLERPETFNAHLLEFLAQFKV